MTLQKLSLLPLMLLLFALLGVSACSSDEVSTSNNVATLSSVTLGTLYRSLATRTADGSRDSVAVSAFSAQGYTLSYDSASSTFANRDSLPYGTDLSRVRFTALNAVGTVTLRGQNGGRDSVIDVSQSYDFRQARKILITSTDGSNRREYTLSLSAHQQNADAVTWQALTAQQWATLAPDTLPRAEAQGSTQRFRLTDTGFVRSTDGQTWSADSAEADNRAFLPTADLTATVLPARNNALLEEAYFYGTQTTADGQLHGRLWKRTIDLSGRYADPWMLIGHDVVSSLQVPALRLARLVGYDGGLFLCGANSAGQLRLVYSPDRGRTWRLHSTLALPRSFDQVSSLELAVSADAFLYLCVDGQHYWRARINRLGWAQ